MNYVNHIVPVMRLFTAFVMLSLFSMTVFAQKDGEDIQRAGSVPLFNMNTSQGQS